MDVVFVVDDWKLYDDLMSATQGIYPNFSVCCCYVDSSQDSFDPKDSDLDTSYLMAFYMHDFLYSQDKYIPVISLHATKKMIKGYEESCYSVESTLVEADGSCCSESALYFEEEINEDSLLLSNLGVQMLSILERKQMHTASRRLIK